MGTPVLWAPPCLTSDCICLPSSHQNLDFPGEAEPTFKKGGDEGRAGSRVCPGMCLRWAWATNLFWKGTDDLSLGLRLLPRQKDARCSKIYKFQRVRRESISWRNVAWMGFCRVRQRGRNGWSSQDPTQRRKKHVPLPRLQGIEVEVKYRKTGTFPSPNLKLRQNLLQNSISSFCPVELGLDIFYSYL